MAEPSQGHIDFSQAVTAEDKAAQAAAALGERIRRRRDRAMAAGITVNGIEVHTDDVSQQRILGAAVAVMRDPTLRITWKAKGGRFVALDANAVFAVADTVRAHVQACFDREAALLAEIESGGAPDIEAGWPGE